MGEPMSTTRTHSQSPRLHRLPVRRSTFGIGDTIRTGGTVQVCLLGFSLPSTRSSR